MGQVMGMLGGQGSEGQKDIVGAFSSLLGGEEACRVSSTSSMATA